MSFYSRLKKIDRDSYIKIESIGQKLLDKGHISYIKQAYLRLKCKFIEFGLKSRQGVNK